MGFFSSVMYPTTEHQITEIELKKLISYLHIPSLKGQEEKAKLIEDAILARRRGDDKISLQQIYETLTKMKNENLISKYMRDETMKVLKTYFAEHFPA